MNVAGTNFVFFKNYLTVLQNSAFRLAFTNTLKFMGICIPILLVFSLLIAVFLNAGIRGANYLKSAYLVPMAISVASVVLIWRLLFHENGYFSGLLHLFGLPGADWMNTSFSFWILVFSYVWKNLGYNIVLWMAGLTAISNNLYEAARVDGANRRQCFFWITLPNLKSTLFTITVLAFLNSFKVFREAYLVGGDYPNDSMYLLQHLFNNWYRELALDKMSAASVMVAAIILVLILVLQRTWDRET
ncbi:MAG: sugar ABC transporter permease [Clostridiales bacterium]|nr:sugar ABC transporter permease [Clostridiales bacterium]